MAQSTSTSLPSQTSTSAPSTSVSASSNFSASVSQAQSKAPASATTPRPSTPAPTVGSTPAAPVASPAVPASVTSGTSTPALAPRPQPVLVASTSLTGLGTTASVAPSSTAVTSGTALRSAPVLTANAGLVASPAAQATAREVVHNGVRYVITGDGIRTVVTGGGQTLSGNSAMQMLGNFARSGALRTVGLGFTAFTTAYFWGVGPTQANERGFQSQKWAEQFVSDNPSLSVTRGPLGNSLPGQVGITTIMDGGRRYVIADYNGTSGEFRVNPNLNADGSFTTLSGTTYYPDGRSSAPPAAPQAPAAPRTATFTQPPAQPQQPAAPVYNPTNDISYVTAAYGIYQRGGTTTDEQAVRQAADRLQANGNMAASDRNALEQWQDFAFLRHNAPSVGGRQAYALPDDASYQSYRNASRSANRANARNGAVDVVSIAIPTDNGMGLYYPDGTRGNAVSLLNEVQRNGQLRDGVNLDGVIAANGLSSSLRVNDRGRAEVIPPAPRPRPRASNPNPPNQPTPQPTPAPQPTPTPAPSPAPTPAPAPQPNPSPTPAPAPSPAPTPAPTQTPIPTSPANPLPPQQPNINTTPPGGLSSGNNTQSPPGGGNNPPRRPTANGAPGGSDPGNTPNNSGGTPPKTGRQLIAEMATIHLGPFLATAGASAIVGAGGQLVELGRQSLPEWRVTPLNAQNVQLETRALQQNPNYVPDNYDSINGDHSRANGHLLEIKQPDGSFYYMRRVPNDLYEAVRADAQRRGSTSTEVFVPETILDGNNVNRTIYVEYLPPALNDIANDLAAGRNVTEDNLRIRTQAADDNNGISQSHRGTFNFGPRDGATLSVTGEFTFLNPYSQPTNTTLFWRGRSPIPGANFQRPDAGTGGLTDSLQFRQDTRLNVGVLSGSVSIYDRNRTNIFDLTQNGAPGDGQRLQLGSVSLYGQAFDRQSFNVTVGGVGAGTQGQSPFGTYNFRPFRNTPGLEIGASSTIFNFSDNNGFFNAPSRPASSAATTTLGAGATANTGSTQSVSLGAFSEFEWYNENNIGVRGRFGGGQNPTAESTSSLFGGSTPLNPMGGATVDSGFSFNTTGIVPTIPIAGQGTATTLDNLANLTPWGQQVDLADRSWTPSTPNAGKMPDVDSGTIHAWRTTLGVPAGMPLDELPLNDQGEIASPTSAEGLRFRVGLEQNGSRVQAPLSPAEMRQAAPNALRPDIVVTQGRVIEQPTVEAWQTANGSSFRNWGGLPTSPNPAGLQQTASPDSRQGVIYRYVSGSDLATGAQRLEPAQIATAEAALRQEWSNVLGSKGAEYLDNIPRGGNGRILSPNSDGGRLFRYNVEVNGNGAARPLSDAEFNRARDQAERGTRLPPLQP